MTLNSDVYPCCSPERSINDNVRGTGSEFLFFIIIIVILGGNDGSDAFKPPLSGRRAKNGCGSVDLIGGPLCCSVGGMTFAALPWNEVVAFECSMSLFLLCYRNLIRFYFLWVLKR